MEDVLGHLTGILAVLLIFGGTPTAIVLIYYFSRKAKNKERMALIEKGLDPSVYMKVESSFTSALLWGMLVVGVGLGAFVGYILSQYAAMRPEFVVPAMSLLFGGIGLVGFYLIRKKPETKIAA